ncbi:MAG: hypothetical protein ACOY3I_09015 [Verrucomicrobiota bacterium]
MKTPMYSIIFIIIILCVFGLPCIGYCSAGGQVSCMGGGGGGCQPKQQMPSQELMQLLQMAAQMLQQMMQSSSPPSGQENTNTTDTSSLQQQIEDLQKQIQALTNTLNEEEEEAAELEKKAEALEKVYAIVVQNYNNLTDEQKEKLQDVIAKIPYATSIKINSDGSISVDGTTIKTNGAVI